MIKNILSVFALIISFSAISAEIDIKYTQVSQSGLIDDFEIVAKNYIYNKTSVNDTLRWIRIKKVIVGGWESASCDNQTCWFPEIDSNEFVVEAGDTANLDVYFYPDGSEGSVDVELLVYRPSDGRVNGVIVSYKTVNVLAGIETLIARGELSVYPNPVVDVLNVVSITHPISNLIILNNEGETIKQNNDGIIHLENFAKGIYLLNFEIENVAYQYRFVKE